MYKREKTKMFCLLSVGILILIIVILTLYVILMYKYDGSSRKSIVKQYYQNELLFTDAASQLQKIVNSDQNIYIYNRNDYITINIYNHNADGLEIVRIDDEDFDSYQHSIDLVKKLHLTRIAQENCNTIFSFSSGQAIVEINNDEKLHFGYHILEKIHIKDNWYYVKIKT